MRGVHLDYIANLAAPPAVVHGSGILAGTLHKPLLDIAGKYPVLANINTTSSVVISQPPPVSRFWVYKIDRLGLIFRLKVFLRDVENAVAAPTTP